ncbi:MAG: N-acetyltransferase [Ruminococcaceae bacterium]|nr:N-acetyltransferase [Oscillospiraceae bacterium]
MSIAKTALIGEGVTIREGVIIEDNVIIGDGSYIDYGVVIRENVTLGKNSFVGAQSILGEFLFDFHSDNTNKNHPLIIGDNALLRSGTVIYGDCVIGDNFSCGHKVTIRECTNIGNNVSVGTLGDIQGRCELGNYTRLHSNVFIGEHSKIGNFVWIFPHVVFTNDPTPPSETLKGIVVDDFACICARSLVMPGVHIGKDALIGACANVTRDIEAEMVAIGNPARVVKNVREVKDENGQTHYPWRYYFDRGMPWQGIGYENWIKKDM